MSVYKYYETLLKHVCACTHVCIVEKLLEAKRMRSMIKRLKRLIRA